MSYDEIKKYLEKKKKISKYSSRLTISYKLVFAEKKTDKITLLDLNKNVEITDGYIDANTRVVVQRTPLTKNDPIEQTYNPKQSLDIISREKNIAHDEGADTKDKDSSVNLAPIEPIEEHEEN